MRSHVCLIKEPAIRIKAREVLRINEASLLDRNGVRQGQQILCVKNFSRRFYDLDIRYAVLALNAAAFGDAFQAFNGYLAKVALILIFVKGDMFQPMPERYPATRSLFISSVDGAEISSAVKPILNGLTQLLEKRTCKGRIVTFRKVVE
jgi:hypothetical protein